MLTEAKPTADRERPSSDASCGSMDSGRTPFGWDLPKGSARLPLKAGW
jgi:hypothetical protein